MTVKGLLDSYLKRLRMPAMAKAYARLAEEAASNKADYLDYLCCLLELEVNHKDENTKKERLAKAKFPVLKSLDTFKFDEIPSLNRKLVLKLFGGKYIQEIENVVFVGGQGTGKTHLAIALGMQACQEGKKVRFFTVADLVHQLKEARDEKQLMKFQSDLSKIHVLILDELGRVECNADGANLLFQVIGARYERSSTIITSNLEFSDWSSVFVSQNLTAAVLDRLIHRCHIVEVNGESYRFKESLRRKKNSKD